MILYGSKGIINRVAASGGETSPVTVLNAQRGEVAQILPFFLPDGKHFLYYVAVSKDSSGIYLGSLDAKPAEQGQKRLIASRPQPSMSRLRAGAGALGPCFFYAARR